MNQEKTQLELSEFLLLVEPLGVKMAYCLDQIVGTEEFRTLRVTEGGDESIINTNGSLPECLRSMADAIEEDLNVQSNKADGP